MATYINYSNLPNRPITILNFVFIENDFDIIKETFREYVHYPDNLFENKSYVAIKNSSYSDGPPGTADNDENYRNLTVCTSANLPPVTNTNEATLFPRARIEGENGFWKPGTDPNSNVFTISGALNDCKLKKIFSDFTRFTNGEAGIPAPPGGDENDPKTLDNTIIFVPKNRIRDLFIHDANVVAGLRGNNLGPITPERMNQFQDESLRYRTVCYYDRCYICNYFRTFDFNENEIPLIGGDDAARNAARNAYGLENNDEIINNVRLPYFSRFIKETRHIKLDDAKVRIRETGTIMSRAGQGFQSVINKIIESKKSLPVINKRLVINAFTGNRDQNYKQHYLGELRDEFKTTIMNKAVKIVHRTPLEKIIFIVLMITFTNGINIPNPGCRITITYAPDYNIEITPGNYFTLEGVGVGRKQILINPPNDPQTLQIEIPAGGHALPGDAVNGADVENISIIFPDGHIHVPPINQNGQTPNAPIPPNNAHGRIFSVQNAAKILRFPYGTKFINLGQEAITIETREILDGGITRD